MVILHNSQQANQLDEGEKPGDSFMMAFDRKTGKGRWRTPLVSMNVCYSVPFIYTNTEGQDELVCISTGNGVFSLDPDTGEKNWAVEGVFSMRTVGSPIAAGGLIFGGTGSGAYAGNYIAAVKPGRSQNLSMKSRTAAALRLRTSPRCSRKVIVYSASTIGALRLAWMLPAAKCCGPRAPMRHSLARRSGSATESIASTRKGSSGSSPRTRRVQTPRQESARRSQSFNTCSFGRQTLPPHLFASDLRRRQRDCRTGSINDGSAPLAVLDRCRRYVYGLYRPPAPGWFAVAVQAAQFGCDEGDRRSGFDRSPGNRRRASRGG